MLRLSPLLQQGSETTLVSGRARHSLSLFGFNRPRLTRWRTTTLRIPCGAGQRSFHMTSTPDPSTSVEQRTATFAASPFSREARLVGPHTPSSSVEIAKAVRLSSILRDRAFHRRQGRPTGSAAATPTAASPEVVENDVQQQCSGPSFYPPPGDDQKRHKQLKPQEDKETNKGVPHSRTSSAPFANDKGVNPSVKKAAEATIPCTGATSGRQRAPSPSTVTSSSGGPSLIEIIDAVGRSAYLIHRLRFYHLAQAPRRKKKTSRVDVELPSDTNSTPGVSPDKKNKTEQPYLRRHLPWLLQSQARWARLSGVRQLRWALLRSPRGPQLSRALFRRRHPRKAVDFLGKKDTTVSPDGSVSPPLGAGEITRASRQSGVRLLLGEDHFRTPGGEEAGGRARRATPKVAHLRHRHPRTRSPPCSPSSPSSPPNISPYLSSCPFLPYAAWGALEPTTLRVMQAAHARKQRQQRSRWRQTVRRLLKSVGQEGFQSFVEEMKDFQRHVEFSEEVLPAAAEATTASLQDDGGAPQTPPLRCPPSPAHPKRSEGGDAVGTSSSASRTSEEEANKDFLDYCEAMRATQPKRMYVMARLIPVLEKLEVSLSATGGGVGHLQQVRQLAEELSRDFDEAVKAACEAGSSDMGMKQSLVEESCELIQQRLEEFQKTLPALKALLRDNEK